MAHGDLSLNIRRQLRQYQEDVTDKAIKAAKITAEGAVPAIQQAAQFRGGGTYLRSLKVKLEQGRRVYKFKYVVYSAAPHYRLTHLLEKGHNIVKKGVVVGRTRAFPHWEKGESYVRDKFPEVLRDLVERG